LLLPTTSMALAAADTKDPAQAKTAAHHTTATATSGKKAAPAKHLKSKAKPSSDTTGRAPK
jgi:hypothetical protein